ncbi:hypothetical protein [Arachidicoccus ginsenosidivorans]|uniref:hypothetical protein n=1 Tax=Arachidicoccus ginsenosidivorans TaxID=496057 RepID=UPI001CEF8D9F|nr:hypothetical protein [Arachidicoccus ginsenosidivorans]
MGAAATVRPNRFIPLIPIDFIEGDDQSSLLYVENSNHIIDGKYLLGARNSIRPTLWAPFMREGIINIYPDNSSLALVLMLI